MKALLLSSPRAGRIMAAVAVGVALLACGGVAARSSTTPRLPALRATSRPCIATQLRVLVDSSAARRTAAGTYLPIDFVNKWQQECVLRGYTEVIGVSVTSGQDARAVHTSGATPSVVLGQNYAAHTWVLIAKSSGGANPAGCRQFDATGLRVNFPHTTSHATVEYPFTACAGASQALLSVRPVLQGLANPTIFP